MQRKDSTCIPSQALFTQPTGMCLTSQQWHEATFIQRDSSLKIMDCEHKTSLNLIIRPFLSSPHKHTLNTHRSPDKDGHTHTHTDTPLSTLPEAVVLIPPSLFSVTHGRRGSRQWSLTARLTFALTTDLFFSGTSSRTGAMAGR